MTHISVDPYAWLKPIYAQIRADPAFARLALSSQFLELCRAAAEHSSRKAEAMRDWHPAAQSALLKTSVRHPKQITARHDPTRYLVHDGVCSSCHGYRTKRGRLPNPPRFNRGVFRPPPIGAPLTHLDRLPVRITPHPPPPDPHRGPPQKGTPTAGTRGTAGRRRGGPVFDFARAGCVGW